MVRFNVFFPIKLPCTILGENQIIADNVIAEVISYQLVPTGEDHQNQVVTEKKLQFDGELHINLRFDCIKKRGKLYRVNRRLLFNHFIHIPLETSEDSLGTLLCMVEDVTYSQIKRKKMQMSVTIIVEYQY